MSAPPPGIRPSRRPLEASRLRLAFVLAIGLVVAPLAAGAQPPGRVWRIGVLVSGSPSSTSARTDAFRQALHELGYVEGQNVVLEYRYGEGRRDRLPGLAAELVQLKVDVIVGRGGSEVRAAQHATRTIPIVMAHVTDPLARGFVASLARPGGNITGLSALAPELGEKRLQLLKEMVPRLSRVAIVGVQEIGGFDPELKALEVASGTLHLQLHPVALRGPRELEHAFSAMTRWHAGAVIGLLDPVIEFLREPIAQLAVKHHLPTAAVERQHVEAGWLMSYGPDYRDLWRQAATYTDKILKGARPADLPVEQPKKFELVVNLKTAKALGLTIPPSVLARADEIIRE